MNKLKIIKTTVVILTFLLVFGMLAALGTVYKKIAAPAPQAVDTALKQPEGSSIENFKISDGKLYLLVKYGGKSDRIIIVEPSHPQMAPVTISIN